jgi:hypothetical protein
LPHNASCWAAEIPFLSLTMRSVLSAVALRHAHVSDQIWQ